MAEESGADADVADRSPTEPPTDGEADREPARQPTGDDAADEAHPPADEAAEGSASASDPDAADGTADAGTSTPADVREYTRFSKMDGATYERVNAFLRDRTYITAREWAIARLCADFRTETGVEMTKIGENLPELVPFMTDTYTPQAVNQARHSFEEKVTKAGATFLYGAMCDFFTADELDDLMYEVTEVAKFLLEVEGAKLSVDEELETEEMIMEVMREVRHSSASLRAEEVVPETCPHCGHDLEAEADLETEAPPESTE